MAQGRPAGGSGHDAGKKTTPQGDRPATETGLADLPPLRDVIAAHGLAARKGLGQHFLLDLNLTARIARAGGPIIDTTVIEVGPGPGGLTRALLDEGAAHVIAIEKDRRCIEALAPLVAASGNRLLVVEADALAVDESALARQASGTDEGLSIVANLPYNVGTALIIKWLGQIYERPERYRSIVLTLQKEVADRLSASPGTKAFGRLSVMSQWLCEVRACFDIGARAFTPPPRVTSAVVCLKPRPRPLAECRWTEMEAVTRAAFGQRRKMLRGSLKGLLPGNGAEALLAASALPGTARPEDLPVEAFCGLARELAARRAAGNGPY